ncbi:Up-regulated during septation-domain-containing protein [Absidia repens]|uniref:Up-regulated during septation-domain-containing protein n=1 Tax=Absidia repens TaxID=90262 RepID=A0A1X2IZT4_9FUNG|nr:Up-regulated during septation-domain-containing protein [Absidia repens]
MNSIPILPRQSNDGDRPSGLKFTRNNYYGFQRDQDTTTEKSPGSSLLSGYSSTRYTDNKSNSSNYSNYSFSNSAGYSTSSSRPSMDTMERPILPAAKERPSYSISGSIGTGTGSGGHTATGTPDKKGPLPNIASPTLPTRSPQRARDSQTSTSQSYYASSSENVSSGYPSSRLYQPTINDTTSPIPTLSMDQNNNFSKGVPSTTSSSIVGYHDSPPSRPRLSEARFSLTAEVAKMWRSQSAPSDPSINNSSDKNRMMIESENLLNELLVSRAVLDSRDFKLLSFDDLDKISFEYEQTKQQVEHSTSKLALELKLRETARSLAYLNDSQNGPSSLQHQREIKALDQKVDDMAHQLQDLKSKEHGLHCQLLEHMAGVLSINIRQFDSNGKHEEMIANQHSKIQSLTSNKNEEMEDLRTKQQETQSTLSHILHQLNTMTEHYIDDEDDDDDSTDADSNKDDGDGAMMLLAKLETTLATQRSRTGQLEREMESVLEKHRLEAMAEKKIEIQLRATQERRDAAEAKCQELIQELELAKASKKSSMSELDRLKADVDNFSFNDNRTLGTQGQFSEMEVEVSKAHAEMASTKQRETAGKLELQHYRDEAFALRQEKNKWERMMKRQTVMQLMDEGAGAAASRTKQEQEYVAQLKEQKAYLDKTSREKESMMLERDQLAATCHDLEELIRGKTRLLDARDIHISELEAQVQELRRQSQQNRTGGGGAGNVDAVVLRELQDAFSQKELAWMEQSANMEANFEGILKEFDRLTGTAVEFESERMNYERKISQLEQRMAVLDGELVAFRVSNLGYEDGGGKDTPTTASLRKEFRRLVNDMKLENQRLLDREANETKRVEKQLKDLKHDVAMSNYEKVNKGVQTLFVK